MDTLLGKTLAELQEAALSVGLQKFAGKQLAEWIYVRRVADIDEMTNISLKGREALKAHYTVGRHAPVREAVSADGTRKYLFEIPHSLSPITNNKSAVEGRGEAFVETVYIPENERATLCVSSQVGCKMGCRFCMTGALGFHGHLSAAEILNQIFEIDRLAAADGRATLSNIVLMGEGEPMDNLDNVLRALTILTASYACAWSPKRITVSTVGIPAMRRFLEESECHLAVSLHNPFPSERAQIMPAEKIMSITQVVELLRQYDWSHQRRVSFEYICWHGTDESREGRPVPNDTLRHAKELVRLLHGLECRVNLIRFHAGVEQVTANSLNERRFPGSDERQMEWLRDYLTEKGITTTIRRSRGEDILAACGMLVNSLETH